MLIALQRVRVVIAVVLACWTSPPVGSLEVRRTLGQVGKEDMFCLTVLAVDKYVPLTVNQPDREDRHWGNVLIRPLKSVEN